MTVRLPTATRNAMVDAWAVRANGGTIEVRTGPKKDAEYETIEDLRDAAIEAGVECPNWRQTSAARFAAASGKCSDKAVMSIYATPGALDNQLEGMVEVAEQMSELLGRDYTISDEPVLVGPNWIINAPDPAALQEELGGTLQEW